MFRALSFLLDFPPLRLPQHAFSPLSLRTVVIFAIHILKGQSGRLDEHSLLTGYEPNVTVEVRSTEITLMFLPSRIASIGSIFNSGEDFGTTLASSENGRKTKFVHAGFTTVKHRRKRQREEKQCNSKKKNSESRSSPVAMYSHKRNSSRDSNVVREFYSESERILSEHREIRFFLLFLRADQSFWGERVCSIKTF